MLVGTWTGLHLFWRRPRRTTSGQQKAKGTLECKDNSTGKETKILEHCIHWLEPAESPDGNSSSDKDEQYMLLLRFLGQGSPSRLLEKLRELEAENCQCVDFVLSTLLRGGLNCFIFLSCGHRRTNTGLNHIVRVSNHMQNKKAYIGSQKRQCAKGESCSFQHDPNRKNEGTGRGRSSSPTRSARNNNKEEGKGKSSNPLGNQSVRKTKQTGVYQRQAREIA